MKIAWEMQFDPQLAYKMMAEGMRIMPRYLLVGTLLEGSAETKHKLRSRFWDSGWETLADSSG